MIRKTLKHKNTHRTNKASGRPALFQFPDDFYVTLMDEITEGITLLNTRGIIEYVNKAASNLLGMPKQRIVGKHFGDFIAPESKADAGRYFARTSRGETVRLGKIKILTKDKALIHVEFSASGIKKSDGRIQVHSIFRDISERIEMESLIREREKMGAVQYFIAGAAQEIRNPLLALSQHLEKLIAEYANRDFEYIGYKEFKDIFHSLSAMQKRAKYCYETTQRLLNIGKQRIGGDERHCDVNGAVKAAIDKIKPSADIAGITVRAQFAKNIPQACISHIELSEVIVNLLTNAVQSITTHNGKIVVRTGKVKGEHAVFIECIDNGVGISAEDVNRVFEPFFTTKHRGLEKNSGLGLSIVRSIVKSHKGEIVLNSSLRNGTRVKLQFPAKK